MMFIECIRRRWVLPSTGWRLPGACTLACFVFLSLEAHAQPRRPETPAARRQTTAPAKRTTPAAARTATPAKRSGSAAPTPAAKIAAPQRRDTLPAAPPVDAGAARAISPGTIPLRPIARAQLRTAPDGPVIGTVEGRGTVLPIARERGWVRVRMEGWVRETDLLPVDSTLRTALSAADLRADPEGSKGKLVRWKVEVLAFQRADALRRDLTLGEPYLLARGPAGENALLYLALPAALATEAQALSPLTLIQITARVRNGRSAPTNVPVLDIETIARP